MKKFLIYILLLFHVLSTGNVWLFLPFVHAEVWDIGHWRDNAWGQVPGTTFAWFNFTQQIRNDGIYSKPNASTIQLIEAGDYLIIATTRDNDTSDGRYNPQLRVSQTIGTWDLFTSHYSGYSRSDEEDESWTRAISIIVWASANSQVQIQKRRDTDAPTWWSVVNASDVQVIRLTQTNYGIYGIWWTGNVYGWITPNTVSIDSVITQSDIWSIEWNTASDTIILKWDNKKYLTAWSTSFAWWTSRTQRVGHLEYDNIDALSTRSYCYTRNGANEYCGLGSMDVVETSTTDISLQVEVFRGAWITNDDGGADVDSGTNTDGNGQMIVLEMPEYLEVFSSEDSVWLQNVTTAQTLNIARDVNISDPLSFTKNTNSLVNVTNPADIFSWANVWTARGNVGAWARQTTFGSITLDGVEQSVGLHWNYSRWNQGVIDTFALGFQPAWIFTTTWVWTTLWVNTDPLPGWAAGGTDRTQPWTLGFFALNLDTLIAPELNQSAYRFFGNTNSSDVWAVLAAQDSSATLSSDGEEFRLRSLVSVTQNKLRQNETDFKLQFSERVGTCDISFTWETYIDVTAATAIAFNDNATPNDEATLTTNANDPINGGTTVVNQTYQELNTFTTSVSAIWKDQDWKWDFSLIDNTAPDSTSYCFRIVESDGTLLDTYSVIPEITTITPPPAPGWVDTNLAFWLKADKGISDTDDEDPLPTWLDSSINGLDATAINAPTYRNDDTNELNYNPVVDFDGVADYMSNLWNGAHSDSYYIVLVPDVEIEWTSSQWVPFGLDCESGTLSAGGPCGLQFGGLALWAFTLSIPDEVITHALGSSSNYRSSKAALATFPAGKPMLVGINDNAIGGITNIYEKWLQVDNTVRNTYQTLANADYSLWRSLDNANPFYYDWKIAEVINYDWGLTTNQRQKIESYLAIKYGITLNSWTQNYIASDGTTFWGTGSNTWYNNDIFWIGRDDTQELGQVKSKSMNDGSVVTLEAQGEWTNITNTFTDIGDKEFFMSGHNNGSNSWSPTDAPWGFSILSREWKVQEIGDVGNVRFSFDVDDGNFDIPVLTAGTNYFFVSDSDDDGNFDNETPVAMTNSSGSIWTSANVNVDDEQKYTIATLASLNNIPTDIALSSDNANENIVNGTTLGSLTTTDADLWDSHTYSLVWGAWDADNGRFTISWANVNFNHSPDHELQATYNIRIQTNDGVGGTYQEAFIITINDIWEATTSTIGFESSDDDNKYDITSGQWNNNTVNPNTWSNALESDNLWVNNSQSCFQITHDSATDGFVEFEYEMSSQAWDELTFQIDGVEEDSFSGTIPYTTYTSSVQTAGPHIYKWCYIKDGAGSAGTDNAYIDDISFINGASDTTAPTITSTSIASGSLLPGWSHSLEIGYLDLESGINTGSAILQLAKWDGVSAYGANIAGTGITIWSVTSTGATYSTNNLDFGRYIYAFQISDNDGNISTSTGAEFYIDTPEFLISTPEIDLGTLMAWSGTFSPTLTITVRTVWAAFDVNFDRSSDFTQGTELIPSFSDSLWYGFQQTPYSGVISPITINQSIIMQGASINTNGEKNTYTYDIQIWALVDIEQAAWDYTWLLDFDIILTY